MALGADACFCPWCWTNGRAIVPRLLSSTPFLLKGSQEPERSLLAGSFLASFGFGILSYLAHNHLLFLAFPDLSKRAHLKWGVPQKGPTTHPTVFSSKAHLSQSTRTRQQFTAEFLSLRGLSLA